MSNHTERLSPANLLELDSTIARPRYNPLQHGVGIVHLGVGAFHRAHQAWFTHRVLEDFGGDWRITGVSMRSSGVRDSLAAQDYLYSVAVKGNEGTDYHVMAPIADMLVAPENPQAVVDAIADHAVKVVTLTVTEKGYSLNNNTGELDFDHADIIHDLASPGSPRSAIGYLVAGLRQRMARGAGPLTIISCDNLSGNGHKLEAAVLAFAGRIDEALVTWISGNTSFPATMVDRIVPATSDDDKAAAQAALGCVDQGCVTTEPFIQWVIEDNFAGPVPAWDKVGATSVTDVMPFEEMKLRMLNASHSAIAYLGWLAGLETVSDVMADRDFADFVEYFMMQELAPTLDMPGDFDVAAYAASLLDRFRNKGLQHKTRQIAMDGSQKIPQRIIPALLEQLDCGGPIDGLVLVTAGWIRYVRGVSEDGQRYSVDDPMAAEFAQTGGLATGQRLDAMLALDSIFPASLSVNDRFREKLADWTQVLEDGGAASAVRNLLDNR